MTKPTTEDKIAITNHFKFCFGRGVPLDEAIRVVPATVTLAFTGKQVHEIGGYCYANFKRNAEYLADDIAVVADLIARLPNILERLRSLER